MWGRVSVREGGGAHREVKVEQRRVYGRSASVVWESGRARGRKRDQ